MRGYGWWLLLLILACAIATGAAFAFGASGLLTARAIGALGQGPGPTVAVVVGLLGALGTPVSALLWTAAALRSLLRTA